MLLKSAHDTRQLWVAASQRLIGLAFPGRPLRCRRYRPDQPVVNRTRAWDVKLPAVDDLKPGDGIVLSFTVPKSTASYRQTTVWRRERLYLHPAQAAHRGYRKPNGRATPPSIGAPTCGAIKPPWCGSSASCPNESCAVGEQTQPRDSSLGEIKDHLHRERITGSLPAPVPL